MGWGGDGDRQIGYSVSIEIPHADGARTRGRRGIGQGGARQNAKRAVALTQQDREIARTLVRDDQVGIAIPVRIGGYNGGWREAHGVRRGGLAPSTRRY